MTHWLALCQELKKTSKANFLKEKYNEYVVSPYTLTTQSTKQMMKIWKTANVWNIVLINEHRRSLTMSLITEYYFYWLNPILGDPGADSWGEMK